MVDLAQVVDPNEYDAEMLARAIFAEHAVGGPDGWKGDANTLLNRLEDGRWGSSMEEVLKGSLSSVRTNSKQWQLVNDPARMNGYEKRVFNNIKETVRPLVGNPKRVDNTKGATHFENVEDFGMPGWAVGATPTARHGKHTYFTGVK